MNSQTKQQPEQVASEREAAFEHWCVTFGVQPWARPIAHEAFSYAWQVRAALQVPREGEELQELRPTCIVESCRVCHGRGWMYLPAEDLTAMVENHLLSSPVARGDERTDEKVTWRVDWKTLTGAWNIWEYPKTEEEGIVAASRPGRRLIRVAVTTREEVVETREVKPERTDEEKVKARWPNARCRAERLFYGSCAVRAEILSDLSPNPFVLGFFDGLGMGLEGKAWADAASKLPAQEGGAE